MPLRKGKTYNVRGAGRVRISSSKAKGKKKTATRLSDGKKVNFGAKGATVSPGTPKGDSYCSRSNGLNSVGFNANTLARADWHCSGNKSKKNGLKPL